jgi:hypothetical protein
MISLLQTLKEKLAIGGVQKPKPADLQLQLFPSNGIIVRPGKWVSVQGRVGIISEVSSFDTVSVDYVDAETGATTESARVSIGLCAVAAARQIPECRKVGLTAPELAALGYF